MKMSIFAGGAMLAVAAAAVPAIAWSAGDNNPGPAQAADQGPPSGGPMMMHRWMGRGVRAGAGGERSPQQACVDRIARRAGFVASIGFKLNLTADQKPLWDKVLTATQAAQDNERKLCASLPSTAQARGAETVIDRMNHRRQILQARLQGLQEAEPAVQALYQALTPDQRAILDHPFRRS